MIFIASGPWNCLGFHQLQKKMKTSPFFTTTRALLSPEAQMAEDAPALYINYGPSARRTQTIICRLAKSPNLLQLYGNIITEHEKRAFIEKVNYVIRHDKAHYLTHHAVGYFYRYRKSFPSCGTRRR